jgi:hypothetical protein
MTDAVFNALQQALALTVEMIDAAAHGDWAMVSELDARRQALLPAETGSLSLQHRETLQALHAHNQTLLACTEQVREQVEQKLSQHQYNHRALQTYVTSAR